MQTMRLFAYQQPSRVQGLLESLVQARELVPWGTRKVTDRSALPSGLQKLIIQALKNGRAWSAWADEERIWLFIAEMSLAPSRERGWRSWWSRSSPLRITCLRMHKDFAPPANYRRRSNVLH